ncbi:hypothetical protein AB685_08255 [Bacillus sp. LL01]|nr:hypothetical protein AB685_08255 [Bacillus sp. LL01]
MPAGVFTKRYLLGVFAFRSNHQLNIAEIKESFYRVKKIKWHLVSTVNVGVETGCFFMISSAI